MIQPISPAQARQARQQFATPEDYLSYELGKAVQELPPLYTRLLAGTLSALVLGAIAWAHFSKVDEVATAQGALIPAQQIRPIQALQGGKIENILVKEGDRVERGDVLLEQSTEVSQAEIDRLREAATLIRQDIARLEAERTGQAQTGVALQDQLLAARRREFEGRRAAAEAEAQGQQAAIAEARARLARLQENLSSARASLANAEERERSLRPLVEPGTGAVPRFDYLEAKDRLTQAQDQIASLQQEIVAQTQAIRRAEEAYRSARQAADRLGSERQSEILAQLNQRREELATVEGQLAQATRAQEQDTVRAPVTGTIYNLQVTLAEGTVQPGKELMSILPEDSELLLEVQILNRDIGFIAPGMRAKVKLATFPYQEFGTIEGEVVQISPNATIDQELGPVFPATIRLSRTQVAVYGQLVDLTPGMAGVAEIVTRQRTILTFLIEPITRRFDEAFQTR
ncbi:HlyD family type I secretion periplasmic adaptor subunit [Thermoleptolyngbya sp. C42_A2020_037]|uniref:HlyD family type I secretion periplasmic adaptor subunit n=1 Tax=Thermoleptolyngbya sp. C42_A2020_037 TaxID=2747799 RepID=UPI0019DA6C52|nr:HlyD family type I secretion periplasmic adaptor subunit [Thermoleptolyngbya sp. C42_A2020_037]MBF2084995.1 HlyD family type I secretion periplasmic adaptor subunit [Thermoleptolyngbya sp. C42_A2020_037]